MKLCLCGALIASLASIAQSSANEIKFKRIEILESNGIPTTLRVFKGRKLFLSSRGEDSGCHSSGIEATLNASTNYRVRCKNSPKGDEGMKGKSFAAYDGHTVRIDARSEERNGVYFMHSWTIKISGGSCTGGIHIESTFGTFDKYIATCEVFY